MVSYVRMLYLHSQYTWNITQFNEATDMRSRNYDDHSPSFVLNDSGGENNGYKLITFKI